MLVCPQFSKLKAFGFVHFAPLLAALRLSSRLWASAKCLYVVWPWFLRKRSVCVDSLGQRRFSDRDRGMSFLLKMFRGWVHVSLSYVHKTSSDFLLIGVTLWLDRQLVTSIWHHCLLLYGCRRIYELQRSASIVFGPAATLQVSVSWNAAWLIRYGAKTSHNN